MERIIAPYGNTAHYHAQLPLPGWGSAAHAPAAKTGRDYVRALCKRWWLALGLWMLVFMPGSLFVLRQPAIYQAQAEIEVVPPQYDAALMVIVDHTTNLHRENTEQFVVSKIAQIKAKSLIDEVVHEFEPTDAQAAAVLAAELFAGISTKRIPGTNLYLVTLDSSDQDRVDKILNTWLKVYADHADEKGRETTENSINEATKSLGKLKAELAKVETDIGKLLKAVPHFAPDGRNRLEEDLLTMKSMMFQQRSRFEDLVQQQRLAEMWPHLNEQAAASDHGVGSALARLYQEKKSLDQQLRSMRKSLRHPDQYSRLVASELDRVCDEIESLQELTAPGATPDLKAMAVTRAGDEIGRFRRELDSMQSKMHETAPQFQRFQSLIEERDHINDLMHKQADNLMKFQNVAGTLKRPIEIPQPASAPLVPVRPNRLVGIAVVVILALILSVGVVLVLEATDRVVKHPEQAANGLTLPLLSVIPRMRRHARICRGAHLWTPGAPESVEADAFRNLRASLVGIEACDRPIISVMVTSPKTGDGKSTTALNLAAACARSGERTILVDCDLRRASLAEVFDADPNIGLVDVLKSDVHWQRAVNSCVETPNLDFMPAGLVDAVPVEILGSLELKQLLAALSRHYHRVILDAPAVLGLADGRILGSLADATLLVVRAGTHELAPMRRAKEMLEQTRARIAGVVFNDLNEDLKDWACHVGVSPIASASDSAESRRAPLGLAGPRVKVEA
jgi:capsular exopolysaccharide synthesis family protein